MRFLYLTTLVFFCHGYSQELPTSGFFADAAMLYWKASEAGLSYAVKSSSTVENPKFEWDFGFKVGMGYRIPHDRWDVKLQFISFQTHTDNEKKGELVPLWQMAGPSIVEKIDLHWRLHLGIVDLLLGKLYVPAKTLFLTPEIGIRAGSVRQKYYLDDNVDGVVHMKNKYFGVGPNVGLLGQWSWGGGWSLCARSFLSLLFGEFYVHQSEYMGKEQILKLHDIFVSSAPIFEMGAGICWEHCFQGTLKRLILELAWDEFF